MMRIGIIMFLFVDVINITINLFPCRSQIISLYKLGKDNKTHFRITMLVLVPSFLIVILYPDIMGMFGICGGIFCTLIGWTVPYLIMIRIYSKHPLLIIRKAEMVPVPKEHLPSRAFFHLVHQPIQHVPERSPVAVQDHIQVLI